MTSPSASHPRRLRSHPLLRDMLAKTRLAPADFIAPIFVRSGNNLRLPINSMPGVLQLSVDAAVLELKRLETLGIKACILFGVTDADKKDAAGSHAHNPDNEVCRTLKAAKDAGIQLLFISDLCYCEYTSHGHCGTLAADGSVDNGATIQRLGQQALLHANAGADIVAPSGMMDNMVAAIRSALDHGGKTNTAILSYAVKYASAFYGPFRDAVETPAEFRQSGDRKGYQMDFRRGIGEALHEAQLDIEQGADFLMVKPGMPYLDVLHAVTQKFPAIPTAVYQVSGEYAMLKAAAGSGALDERAAVLETMHAFKRAGAQMIITYYAPDLAEWLA